MFRRTDDLRIRAVRPLIPPAILLEEIGISERASNVVADARLTVAKIVNGEDPRVAVIVGPCSIHDTTAALEYADRLKKIAEDYIKQVGAIPPLTMDELLEHTEAVLKAAEGLGGKLGESLRLNADEARMSRELARLRRDLSLGWNLKSFRLP